MQSAHEDSLKCLLNRPEAEFLFEAFDKELRAWESKLDNIKEKYDAESMVGRTIILEVIVALKGFRKRLENSVDKKSN